MSFAGRTRLTTAMRRWGRCAISIEKYGNYGSPWNRRKNGQSYSLLRQSKLLWYCEVGVEGMKIFLDYGFGVSEIGLIVFYDSLPILNSNREIDFLFLRFL